MCGVGSRVEIAAQNKKVKALELSREYFFETALPELRAKLPEVAEIVAAGLCGNGSECFGYDDELSRDHDWGVDFFMWLPDDRAEFLPKLEQFKCELFAKHPPRYPRSRSAYGANARVETVGSFYKSLTGCETGPHTLREWVNVPEENLALSVNGEVFIDGAGHFTKTRGYLLEYFPEDLWVKRISFCAMKLAQTGQYNFERCIKRSDIVTARTALSLWCDNVIRLVFLLNRRYRPYYKWQFRMMTELSPPGGKLASELELLAALPLPDGAPQAKSVIERICARLAEELKAAGLSEATDSFLLPHGESVWSKIKDESLRALPLQYDI